LTGTAYSLWRDGAMNRMERLTAILLLLQARKRTSTELAGHFEVSKRTILRDVQGLSEMGIPVVAEEGANGGYSLLPEFSLSPLQLTYREALLLLLALQSVADLAATPFAGERESLLAKIRALIPATQLRQAEGLLQHVQIEAPERIYTTPFLDRL